MTRHNAGQRGGVKNRQKVPKLVKVVGLRWGILTETKVRMKPVAGLNERKRNSFQEDRRPAAGYTDAKRSLHKAGGGA